MTVLSELLQPYRERPQTSKLLADRLVTGALGMRSKMTREERVKEREKLKEAKSEIDGFTSCYCIVVSQCTF